MGRQALITVTVMVLLGLVGSAALLDARLAMVNEPRQTSAAPVAVQRVSMPAGGIRDEATMVLVGTALIGLGTAVRRAA